MKYRSLIRYTFLSIPFFVLVSCVSISGETKKNMDQNVAIARDAISKNVKPESRVAILDIHEITNSGKKPKQTSRSEYMSALLVRTMVETGKFIIIDKTSFSTRKGGQKFQSPDGISDDQTIPAGWVLGADIVITGAITNLGKVDYLRVKAIDVKTGQIICMTYEPVASAVRKW
ncbi:hypothetical protein AGMMS49940_12570 [Spirochaetia bacterium]|nr:hypothetical protein AGMMS49940_12570 [Spirochaetia bacterium]